MRSLVGYYRPGQSYPRRSLREGYPPPSRTRVVEATTAPVGGGYNVYIGVGHPDNIDYIAPIASRAPGISSAVMSITALALSEDIDYYIDVLAETTAGGVESLTGGPVHVRIESGALVAPRPNSIAIARATASAGGKVRLEALYDATDELAAATKIAVGRIVSGAIDWSSPVEEIAISGTTTIDQDLVPTYTHGELVHLAVRAETAAGVQGPPRILAPVVADTTGPPAPAELTAAQE